MTSTSETLPTPTGESTLAEVITERPVLAGVLRALGVDFCCHGDATLRVACERAGVELDTALAAITSAVDLTDQDTDDWTDLGPADLCDHIEKVHHAPLHAELADLVALAEKVMSVHAVGHPELEEVRRLVAELEQDFVPHLMKEERILFPAIRSLTEGVSGFGFGSVANPIAVMTSEHETVGNLLKRLREVTAGFATPAGGCVSYRTLYQRLDALEADTHVHVFKENFILFPAAVDLEANLINAATSQR